MGRTTSHPVRNPTLIFAEKRKETVLKPRRAGGTLGPTSPGTCITPHFLVALIRAENLFR